jgi:hypothetical protein
MLRPEIGGRNANLLRGIVADWSRPQRFVLDQGRPSSGNRFLRFQQTVNGFRFAQTYCMLIKVELVT